MDETTNFSDIVPEIKHQMIPGITNEEAEAAIALEREQRELVLPAVNLFTRGLLTFDELREHVNGIYDRTT